MNAIWHGEQRETNSETNSETNNETNGETNSETNSESNGESNFDTKKEQTITSKDIKLEVSSITNFIQRSEATTPSRISQRRKILLSGQLTQSQRFARWHQKNKTHLDTCWAVCLFFFDVYKITMGSFLTLFTYQKCDILSQTFGCFMDPFELFCLCWNVLTFVMCFVVLGYRIHRESYLIRELDFGTDFHGTVEEYFAKKDIRNDIYGRDVVEQVEFFNAKYALTVKLATVAFLLNVLFSAIGLFSFSYMGVKTLTSFYSGVLLLGLLLADAIYVVHLTECQETTIAYSSYKRENKHYNVHNILRLWNEHQKQKASTSSGKK